MIAVQGCSLSVKKYKILEKISPGMSCIDRYSRLNGGGRSVPSLLAGDEVSELESDFI